MISRLPFVFCSWFFVFRDHLSDRCSLGTTNSLPLTRPGCYRAPDFVHPINDSGNFLFGVAGVPDLETL